uniref:Uncharacterized protein n=1 Tax=Plectus sambesii TaxID=2011161 RepID=A0A914VVN2_9BILA
MELHCALLPFLVALMTSVCLVNCVLPPNDHAPEQTECTTQSCSGDRISCFGGKCSAASGTLINLLKPTADCVCNMGDVCCCPSGWSCCNANKRCCCNSSG